MKSTLLIAAAGLLSFANVSAQVAGPGSGATPVYSQECTPDTNLRSCACLASHTQQDITARHAAFARSQNRSPSEIRPEMSPRSESNDPSEESDSLVTRAITASHVDASRYEHLQASLAKRKPIRVVVAPSVAKPNEMDLYQVVERDAELLCGNEQAEVDHVDDASRFSERDEHQSLGYLEALDSNDKALENSGSFFKRTEIGNRAPPLQVRDILHRAIDTADEGLLRRMHESLYTLS